MAVLTHPVGWRREAKRDVEADLTADEQKHVRAAILFLAKRYGSVRRLAQAMRLRPHRVENAASRGVVTASLALRVARAAGAPMEDVLSGRWPTPGMCPYCGRG